MMKLKTTWTRNAALAAGLVAILTACGSPFNGSVDSESLGAYVEPLWMAEMRRQLEEFESSLNACVIEAGWADGTGTRTTEDTIDAYTQVHRECSAKVLPDWELFDEAAWRADYPRLFDIRDCLIAQGYEIPEPPSEDTWVETALTGAMPWTPFNFVIDGINNGSIVMTQAEFDELTYQCPQSGAAAYIDLGS